jgi:hypothetical protein
VAGSGKEVSAKEKTGRGLAEVMCGCIAIVALLAMAVCFLTGLWIPAIFFLLFAWFCFSVSKKK